MKQMSEERIKRFESKAHELEKLIEKPSINITDVEFAAIVRGEKIETPEYQLALQDIGWERMIDLILEAQNNTE